MYFWFPLAVHPKHGACRTHGPPVREVKEIQSAGRGRPLPWLVGARGALEGGFFLLKPSKGQRGLPHFGETALSPGRKRHRLVATV